MPRRAANDHSMPEGAAFARWSIVALGLLAGPSRAWADDGLAPDIAARIAMAQQLVAQLRMGIEARLAAFADVPAALLTGLQELRASGGVLPTALVFLAMLAAGIAAEWLTRRPWRRSAAGPRPPADIVQRLQRAIARLAADLGHLLAFTLAALAALMLIGGRGQVVPAVLLAYLGVVVVVRLVQLASRALLAPQEPQARLCAIGDAPARFLHRQNLLAATLGAFGFLTCGLLAVVGAGDGPVHQLMLLTSGAAACLVLALASLRARVDIAADLATACPEAGWLRRAARRWPFVSAAAVVGLWTLFAVVGLLGGRLPLAAGGSSLVVLVGLPHVLALLECLRLAAATDGGKVAARMAHMSLLVGLPVLLAWLWAGGLPGDGRAMGTALDLVRVLLLAYLAWEAASLAIDRQLRAEGSDGHPAVEEGGEGASRLATLLPPLRLALQAAVLGMAGLSILAALDVDIRPLLAGAGVVGLAVGFGAQTLVRDVISGIFFLLDDAFRRGEYIDVGSVKGTVERISVRSFVLRHHRGALHTIPFGQIGHLTNYSRDWVIMKLVFRLPFDTDVALVGRLFKQIGRELLARPDIGPDFIEPFKSQGVAGTDEEALLIRAKFTARPGRQFAIRREIYDAVQRAFAAHGIRPAGRATRIQLERAPAARLPVTEPTRSVAA